MNKVIITGNLTKDPVVRDVGSSQVASFRIASNRRYKTKQGDYKDDTLFINCEVWDKGADVIMKYMKKGNKILLEGSLRLNEWENSDGNKVRDVFIRVENFEMLGGSNKSDDEDVSVQEDEEDSSSKDAPKSDENGGGIPF